MASITFRVLEGLERGESYEFDSTPITMGREEENHIRLNDERVSRYHVKIQESEDKVFLTDLQSTNGTRVNGYPVHMHILVPGDLINIGRCLLVFGSPEQIQQTYSSPIEISGSGDFDVEKTVSSSAIPDEAHLLPIDQEEPFGNLFPSTVPPLPESLTGSQVAQLSDLLSFIHSRLGLVVQTGQALSSKNPVDESEDDPEVESENDNDPIKHTVIPQEAWQQLLDMELRIATYIREISNPNS